jgi:hypothetical protein
MSVTEQERELISTTLNVTPNANKTSAAEDIVAVHRNRNTTKYVLPKIVFCAVWRDLAPYAKNNIPKFIQLAKQITSEFHFVFYENDSTDDTRMEILRQCKGNGTICTILVENNVTGHDDHRRYNQTMEHNGGAKTARIARARNKVLEYSERNFAHYDYMVMMDPDTICLSNTETGTYDANIFKYVFWELGDQWDVLTFRQTPYFDWWAFRHPVLLKHNFIYRRRENRHSNQHKTYDRELADHLDNLTWPGGLMEVHSSFSLFAIYRMSLLTPGIARYRGYEPDGTVDCEHTAFHFDLRLKMKARHRLSVLTYCYGDENNATYRPLPRNITDRWMAGP